MMQATAPRQAEPGIPAHLPLHRVTIRFERDHNFRCDPITGALDRWEDRTAYAYFQGVNRSGLRIYRLADESGEPRERIWLASDEEIIRDVPAERQPDRVPEAVLREREKISS